MKTISARLKKNDSDIEEFFKNQSNKEFSLKLLVRYGISKFGKNTDLINIKDEIGKKGLEAVIKGLK